MEKHAELSSFKKLLPLNKPVYAIVVAFIASANNGAAMPIFGVFLSKMLSLLSLPLIFWELMEGPDYVKDNISYYCIWMTVIAVLAGLGSFL